MKPSCCCCFCTFRNWTIRKHQQCFLGLILGFMLASFFFRINIFSVPYMVTIRGVQNSTNLTCEKCFSASFDISVDIPNLCHGNVTVVIAIEVAVDKLASREVIRNTWLSELRNTNRFRNVRYFFLLGQPADEKTRLDILNETKVYQDIVVAEFTDTYRNLTLKTVVGMKWLANRCPDAEFFLKTDDDIWVDVDNLLGTLKQYHDQLRTSIGGVCRFGDTPIRYNGSKWYASFSDFPGNTYDPYCSGTGYVGGLQVAKGIADIYEKVPYLYLEDVFVGMCLKVLGYGAIALPHFDNGGAAGRSDCTVKTGGYVIIHKVPTDRMERIHESTCNITTPVTVTSSTTSKTS